MRPSSVPLITPVLLALLVPPGAARAAHPYASDDAATLGAGAVEIELSGQAAGATRLGALGVGLASSLGLLDWLDVAVAVTYGAGSDSGAWTAATPPPSLSVKLAGVPGGGVRPGVGVRLDYQPAASGEHPLYGHDARLVALSSWQRGRLAIHVNVGAHHHVDDGGAAWSSIAGARVAIATGDRLTFGAEVALDGVATGLHGGEALAGLAWQHRRARVVSVGLGASAGSGRGGAGWFASLGYTVGFGGASPDSSGGRAPDARPAP